MHHKKACNYDGLHFLSVETARFQIHHCDEKSRTGDTSYARLLM